MPSGEFVHGCFPLKIGGCGTARQKPRCAPVSSDGAFKLMKAASLKQVREVIGEKVVSFDDVGIPLTDEFDETTQQLFLVELSSVENLFPARIVREPHGQDPVVGLSRIARSAL